MNRFKLDLEGLSQEELRNYQDLLVSTISRLKHGLFNAEAALGLSTSISLLTDLHLQVSTKSREIQEKLDEMGIQAEVFSEEA